VRQIVWISNGAAHPLREHPERISRFTQFVRYRQKISVKLYNRMALGAKLRQHVGEIGFKSSCFYRKEVALLYYSFLIENQL